MEESEGSAEQEEQNREEEVEKEVEGDEEKTMSLYRILIIVFS